MSKLIWLIGLALPLVGQPLFTSIREGRHAEAERLLDTENAVNAAREDGITPLLHAVITSDARMVKLLIDKGADVNAKTAGGVAPLHAAVYDLEKTRLLLGAKADANVATAVGATPLISAVARRGSLPILEALVAAGADVNAMFRVGQTTFGTLRFALQSSDAQVIQFLLDRGADAKAQRPLNRFSMQQASVDCVQMLVRKGAPVSGAQLAAMAGVGSLASVKVLAEAGAAINEKDERGYTPLMRAAMSHTRNREVVEYLLSKGADAAIRNETGATALSIAERSGNSPVVEALKVANAPGAPKPAIPEPVRGNTVKAAIERGVPLIEKIGPPVFKQRGCISCHNNTQPAIVVAMARKRGFAVDEGLAKRELAAIAADDKARFARMIAGSDLPEISAYVLLALDAAGQAPNTRTDLSFHQIAYLRQPEGQWLVKDYRPPQEYSEIAATGLAIRGLQAYAPPGRAAEARERVARAGAWLARAKPYGVEEQAMRLLGLGWAKASANVIEAARKDLIAAQLADGGWAQLPGMAPDAYATGLALYALHVGAGVQVKEKVYQRGVRHLLDTQRPDGSWFVESRSYPFQPYFESGFPYGHNQWISAAGSSWALLALLLTVPVT